MSDTAIKVVELMGVTKRYGDFTALHKTDLVIEEGSFLTLLGPSGCGKTTTLRMIAGLTSISDGEIRIKGNRVNEVPIHKRNLGIVFQNYALFPHKTVYENVAFGLKYRKVQGAEVRKRVEDALELVQLPQTADRMPSQLSGGQQQRIALARAIVVRPDVLLLDEPLSALDAHLREDMRIELKRIQHTLGITTVFVTHDQSEALAMSDQIVVMKDGCVEQIGAPQDVYNRPASEFVASFLGNSNILSGKISSILKDKVKIEVPGIGGLLAESFSTKVGAPKVGDAVKLSIRAEKLALASSTKPSSKMTTMQGRVTTVDYQGQVARYFLQVGEYQLQAINPIDQQLLLEGQDVAIQIHARDCVILPG